MNPTPDEIKEWSEVAAGSAATDRAPASVEPRAITRSGRRVLEPHERISEVLFGLIMVLTFTGSLSLARAGHDDIRVMLIGALGCNLAWGIIDGVLYLMGCLAQKGRNLATLRAIRAAGDSPRAQQLIANALPGPVAAVLKPADLEMLRNRLTALPEPPTQARLSGTDWIGAIGVFLLVFLSTLPVAVPFMCLQKTALALRISNAIAIGMLFLAGCAYGRCIGRSPGLIGLGMVGLGAVLVGLTIALGG